MQGLGLLGQQFLLLGLQSEGIQALGFGVLVLQLQSP